MSSGIFCINFLNQNNYYTDVVIKYNYILVVIIDLSKIFEIKIFNADHNCRWFLVTNKTKFSNKVRKKLRC